MLHALKKVSTKLSLPADPFLLELAQFMIILFLVNVICITKKEAAAIEKSMNAIAESRERLQTIISNLPGFVYRCAYDSDWTMFLISEGCEDITGYSPDELINNRVISFNDIIDRDYQQQIWNLWIIAIRERKVFESEYPVHNKNGEMRWVWERGRGIYSEKGEVLFLEGFITDITERKQTDESLIIFRETVENSTDAIGISSPRGRHYIRTGLLLIFLEISGRCLLKLCMLINRPVKMYLKPLCPGGNG
jgi:PAS domain S-box-containing protein